MVIVFVEVSPVASTPLKIYVPSDVSIVLSEYSIYDEFIKIWNSSSEATEYYSGAKNTTNISASFSAKGTVTIKVYVDDIIKGTKEINMNSTTSCIFE